MLSWIGNKIAKLSEESSLRQKIEERFPPHALYRVPDEFASLLPNLKDEPRFSEPGLSWWKELYDTNPSAPKTDAERIQREEIFWRIAVKNWASIKENNVIYLKPKQAIMDFYNRSEKSITRQYYAYTGILIPSPVPALVPLVMNAEKRLNDKRALSHKILSPRYDGAARNHTEALDKLEHYIKNVLPEMEAKWSGWFYFNISEAFEKLQREPVRPVSQTATAPQTHPAQSDLTYKPNT